MDSTKIAHATMAARPMLWNHPRLRFLDGAPEGAAVVPVGPQVEEQAKEIDWKAEARKWESRAKENHARAEENSKAAARLAELEESQKTEQQKLQEQLDRLTAEKAAAERSAARMAVIAKYQIPEEFAELVHGDTEEALAASAEKVAALVSKQSDGRVVITAEGEKPALALNGDGIERALKDALGIA